MGRHGGPVPYSDYVLTLGQSEDRPGDAITRSLARPCSRGITLLAACTTPPRPPSPARPLATANNRHALQPVSPAHPHLTPNPSRLPKASHPYHPSDPFLSHTVVLPTLSPRPL